MILPEGIISFLSEWKEKWSAINTWLICFYMSKSHTQFYIYIYIICTIIILCILSVHCIFWYPSRTDGKVMTFLMVWKFRFMTMLNYTLLFDLTFSYFVLSAFLKLFAYNNFMARCSDFLTPLMGVVNDPYVDSFCSPSNTALHIISKGFWSLLLSLFKTNKNETKQNKTKCNFY